MSVVNNSFQRILRKALTTGPQLQIEELRSPVEGKRLHRISASAGSLRVHTVLSYCRVVSLRSARRQRAGEAARHIAPQTGLIRIGTGRDAADTSFATLFGPVAFSSMKVTMEPMDGKVPQYRTDAISTASPG